MLPKLYRISKADFSVVGKTGTRLHTSSFQWITSKNTFDHSRLGIIIGKRVSKSAVQRNRMKRMIRDVFIKLEKDIHPKMDIMCIAKPHGTSHTSAEIQKEMHTVIEKPVHTL